MAHKTSQSDKEHMKQSTSFAQVATNLLNVLQGYTKGIRFVAVLTMLLSLGIGQAWGAEGDIIKSFACSVSSATTYARYTPTCDDIKWNISLGQTRYIGTNKSSNFSNLKITNNTDLNAAKGVNSSVNTSSQGYVTIIPQSAMSRVGKITISCTALSGSPKVYVVSSSSLSTSYSQIELNTGNGLSAQGATMSTSGLTFEFDTQNQETYYAVVLYSTAWYRLTDTSIEFIEGASAPTCTRLKMSTVTATPGDSKITLTWSAVDNASNYTVTCPGGTVGSVTGASTKTCTITGLTNGTSYNWSVMPVGNGTTYCEENTPATGSTTPNATYSITYHDKDGAQSVDALGGSVLLEVLPNNPTSCDIDIYPYFVGWSTTDIPSGGTTEQPTLVSAEIVNSTTSSKTYYAVWSDVDPNAGGGSWEKATSISVGDKVVFVHEEKMRELTGVTSNIGTATERTDGIPDGIEGTYVLTVEAGTANNSYSFKNGSNYLSWPSGSNNLYTSTTKDNASSWTINTSTGGNFKFANVGTTGRILQFNSSNPRWACYTSSQSAFQIYKQSTAAGTATYITSCTTETTVTLNPNGGGTISDNNWKFENGVYKLTTEDESITLPEITRAGYTFDGWATSAGGGEVYNDKATINLDGTAVNLYAIWTPITYTITYELDGGTNHVSNPANYTIETATIKLQDPNKTNHNFVGWYKESTFATQVTQIAKGSTGNITLYAKWTPIEYTITYNAGTGTCNQTTAVGTYPIGVTLPTSSPSSKCASEGWTFAGWAATIVSATSTAPTLYYAGDTYRPTADVELHAVYVKNTFILSLVYNSITYYIGAYESSKSILQAETDRNNAVEFQIVDGSYLRCESGYVSHNSTTNTNISCFESKDKVFPWTITETNGTIVFQSTKAEGNARYLGFNYNSGNPRFAAYVDTYVHDLTKTTISTYDSNPDCCSTIAPTNGAYNTDSDTEVILTWEDANNYGRYHITGGNLAAEGVYSENKNYTVSGLTKCQSYTFQVTAYPTDGCESPAITIEATPYKVKTVTFIDESSTTTQYTSCEAESVTVPTASKDCYTSVWKDQDGKEYNSGATITPTKDLTLTAHYNIITYTIQFVDENGTTILQSSTVDCGTTPSYTGSTPTKDSDEIYDYEFAGWNPTIVAAKSDATYTATYNKTKRTYTVQWYVNGVQYGTDQTVTAGETATAPAIAEVPCGAVIAGWTDAEGGNYVHTSTLHVGATPSIEIRSNKIFYAVFADYEE